MNNTISVKAEYLNNTAKIKMLIRHVMETGQRQNEDGTYIPADFIKKIQVIKKTNNQVIFSVDIGPSISKDPLIAFKTKNLNKGDAFIIMWEDYQGKKNEVTDVVK
jgi:sulfur-oxidizing protein SoxZ